ncbi:hypothetical protein CONPUDRAFT_167739 [Coniophora puteana RWD-64-598 SS2]|uniref:Uncharacterized protein n=1 Tax=Coniophora puteana (strain RWD-64-598) TaxID=741705 RepID=A0A5M3MG73_CONPW|nr:uncharacterized protein CONPUDRAFT_167739 [Coniophora puteana RWD-64-598 SS2]EIW77615.1 hypothetical protein CONPUDRAFT_167739 [Coniophora puteana RWD-64-598 SS2]
MSGMLIPILKWVGSMAAKAYWNAIQRGAAGPPADRIDEVLKGQEQIITEIENLSIKIEIVHAMKLILYWTKRLGEIMTEMKKSGKINVDNQNYQELLRALRSESDGVRYQTFSIHTAIMGTPNNPLGGDALSTWHKQAYNKLSDQSNFDYHMSDYVKELNGRITPVAYLLRQALILSMFTAGTEDDAESLRAECQTRCSQMVDTLYGTHYPPALRFLKPSFEDPGKQLGTQYFWFKQKDKDGYYLVMQDFYIPSLGSFNRAINRKDPEVWAFTLKQNAHELGPMQLISAWANHGNQRIRRHWRWAQEGWKGAWEYEFSTDNSSDSDEVLFKLIPLQASEAGSEPALRLIPYSTNKAAVRDKNGTFDLVFIPSKISL